MKRFAHRLFTRRHILKTAGAGLVANLPCVRAVALNWSEIQEQKFSRQNRLPLKASAFYPLSLGSVRPQGWLRTQLEIQASGLSGHLDEVWPDVGPNSGWLGGTGESWERGPYFVDGLLPLAHLLDDESLKAKANRFIQWTLTHQAPNGMIGPSSNNDWWPRMVMLKALTQYYEVTQDERVIAVLSKYFNYQCAEFPARPLASWGRFRWQDEALTLLWLYNRTGDAQLIELFHLLKKQGFDWRGNFEDFKYTVRSTKESIGWVKDQEPSEAAMATHGVNNAQGLKASAVSYLASGSEKDRNGTLQHLRLLDQYHGLPNGMFSADEHLAGRDPSQGIELCAVVEQMFSLEQSLAILGHPELGDRLEKIAYNALPGALTEDMWAHQYNQEPNQVECSLHRKPWTTDGPESNLFGLEPNFGCCTANYHQGWPKFATSLWMTSNDDGVAAVVYAPSEATIKLSNGTVRVKEETEYPFKGIIKVTVDPADSFEFPLHLRIPAWAEGASIKINGRPQSAPSPGTFARIVRRWDVGDVVELEFPMHVRMIPGYRDSISIERGPLVFSLPIEEDWLKLRDRGLAADWQIYPASQWNYALISSKATSLTAVESDFGKVPFSALKPVVRIKAHARKLASWRAEDGVADTLPQSPVITQEPLETIELVPYASTKLRITSFPYTIV